jgi:hypothetical protein
MVAVAMLLVMVAEGVSGSRRGGENKGRDKKGGGEQGSQHGLFQNPVRAFANGRAPAQADVPLVQACRSHPVMVMMVVMMFVMVAMVMVIIFGGSRNRRKSESRDQHSRCDERFQHGHFPFFAPKMSLGVPTIAGRG